MEWNVVTVMSKPKQAAKKTQVLREDELCPRSLLGGQEKAFAKDIKRYKMRRREFVAVRCPACNKKNSKKIFKKFTFIYRECLVCKTIFMSPRPNARLMREYYENSENYRFWAKYIFPASEVVRNEKVNRPRLEQIVEICKKHKIPKNHLVEIGAGFGAFAELVKKEESFRSVTVVEPTPEMAAACRARGVQVIPRPVESLKREISHADVVVAFEVLEHLFDPSVFFRKVARLIRKKSILVVSCPNGRGFDIAALGPDSLAVDPEHVNLLNPDSISLLGSRCGFRCLEVRTPGRLDAEYVRLAALREKINLVGQSLLKRILLEEWERLGIPFQGFLAENNLSSHMWAVFKKNG